MKCENCGENEANIHYTQTINGVKEEWNLCSECAEQLDFYEMNSSLPIDFSSFFGEFLEDNHSDILKDYLPKQTNCNKCGMTLEEFSEIGKFGCDNCYEVFKSQINQLLKNIYGTDTHIGRRMIINSNQEKVENKKIESNSKQENNISKIEKLKQELKQAIKVENYEEAALIRDEIKKLEEERGWIGI